jgi:hypothetical protein
MPEASARRALAVGMRGLDQQRAGAGLMGVCLVTAQRSRALASERVPYWPSQRGWCLISDKIISRSSAEFLVGLVMSPTHRSDDEVARHTTLRLLEGFKANVARFYEASLGITL